MRTAVLAGGTGGAKLAAGMQEVSGAELSVVANTGDDVEVLGVHVSPDPDLITYWLSGEIDEERGWGIRDDTFTAFGRLVQLGAPGWFQLSDRDLAACLRRRQLLDQGMRPTEVQLRMASALGVVARVLPMADQPVRTRVRAPGGDRREPRAGRRREPVRGRAGHQGTHGELHAGGRPRALGRGRGRDVRRAARRACGPCGGS